jgi:Zn-dependent membrane protease YugP
MRTALVPATQFGSFGSYIFILIGMFFHSQSMILAGALLFAVVVAFSLVTLPVEWDASARARRLMVSAGIVSYSEQEDAGRVLNAAFLTYVASAVTSLLTLLYYLYRAGLLGGRRDD